MWVSTSLSRVFTKKEEILIGRKSFGVMWESWPAFGINITLTSSHLDGMWLIASQPWKMAVSQGREEPVRAGVFEELKRVNSTLDAVRV